MYICSVHLFSICLDFPARSHKIRTFCATPFTYLTARFISVSKRTSLGGAKHRFEYVNPGTFYYVDIGTHCCVFIKSLQKRFRIQNMRDLSLKANTTHIVIVLI